MKKSRLLLGSTPEQTRALVADHLAFLDDYAAALAAFRAGDRDVSFPTGTYKLHHVYGAARKAATAAEARAAS